MFQLVATQRPSDAVSPKGIALLSSPSHSSLPKHNACPDSTRSPRPGPGCDGLGRLTPVAPPCIMRALNGCAASDRRARHFCSSLRCLLVRVRVHEAVAEQDGSPSSGTRTRTTSITSLVVVVIDQLRCYDAVQSVGWNHATGQKPIRKGMEGKRVGYG